ncbi:fam-f protein [Plasmodium relictum]|uniref:Fam-f protein n=1 Tax=Plasmodium relictum TaxID=85471 RepID=A0A1J1GNP3_PLARL|nr:fam-f protein [Plasmodium relictum]CRG85477.1 fam-f protein [Plasmodium relictum]
MRIHLFLIFYFNFLYIIIGSKGFYNIDAYYNLNKPDIKCVKCIKTQIIRNLAEVFNINDEDILDDSGLTIRDVQLLYNLSETKDENTVLEGYFGDSRSLFVKLVDLVFLEDFNERLKQEKKNINSMYYTLELMENKIMNYLDISLDIASNHIKCVFKNLESHENELRSYTNVNVDMNISKNGARLTINRNDADDYFRSSNLGKKIDLWLKKSFKFFNKLRKMNNEFLSEINKDMYDYNLYMSNYIGTSENMFPLKYAHLDNLELVNFNDSLEKILGEFHRFLFTKNKLKGTFITNDSLIVYIEELNFLIHNMHKTLHETITLKTHKLFVKLNKKLNGDIKCMIAFIAYILEHDKSKNKFKLDELKNKHGKEVIKDKFLLHIYKLLLQEKEEINKSSNKFKTYIKEILGFDVDSSGIKSLVQKLYGLEEEDNLKLQLNEKDGFIPLFRVIVYSLGCLRKLKEYSDFIELLKSESEISFSTEFENILKGQNDALYIPEHKSRSLTLQFLDIYESSIFFIGLRRSNSELIDQSTKVDSCVKKIRALNSLISLLIDELKNRNKFHFCSVYRELSKNAIIFFLYAIKRLVGNKLRYFVRYE